MLIKKRTVNGSLQTDYSETLHEKETQEFRAYLENKGYDPGKIIKEEVEEVSH